MNQESPNLIGQILVALKKVTREQLDEALRIQQGLPADSKKPLGQILLELDYVDPNDIIEAIRVQMQMRSSNNAAPEGKKQ